jgi:hypothetical protein
MRRGSGGNPSFILNHTDPEFLAWLMKQNVEAQRVRRKMDLYSDLCDRLNRPGI